MHSPTLKKIGFQKIEATGNDFVFIDARGSLPKVFDVDNRSAFAKTICDRHYGVGADGLVFLSGHDARLKWDFYNSDGSPAEMCGNASRCVGRWATQNSGLNHVELETVAGLVRLETFDQEISAHMDYLKLAFTEINYSVNAKTGTAIFLNTGVPHAVVTVENIANTETLSNVVGALRFHPDVGERGCNVTFLEKVARTEFKTVTFERGVEGFTLSCGTGVLAAAAVGLRELRGASVDELKSGADVSTPGGKLRVKFGTNWCGASLIGPAKIVFTGELSLGGLK